MLNRHTYSRLGKGRVKKQGQSHRDNTNSRKKARTPATKNKDKLAQREGSTGTKYTRRGDPTRRRCNTLGAE